MFERLRNLFPARAKSEPASAPAAEPASAPSTAAVKVGIPRSDNIDFFTASFEAASRNLFKGYFWFPSHDPTIQMPQWSRETIAMKSNWLYNNVGPVHAVIDGLSGDEVDTGIWPKATTSSPAFNKLATDRFHESWKDARFFDTRACENFYSAQLAVRRHVYLHGELFGELIRPDNLNPFVRLHFITNWQVRNSAASGTPSDPDFREGIKSDKFGAPLIYRCSIGTPGLSGTPNGDYIDVPAEDMLHFHDAFWVGQKRGMPALAPVAKKLFSMKEVEDAVANGVQLRADVAYAIERKEGDTGGPTMIPGVVSTQEVETPDGGNFLVHKLVRNDNREVTIAEPPAGRTIKTLESNATIEPFGFKKDVLADVAYCFSYPPDYVFALGTGSLGTEVRWKVRRVQGVKNRVRQFQLIPQFVEPLYRFRTWQDIKRGFYKDLPGGIPVDWWKAKYICPADTTVDIGREGRLLDERVATGKMSEEDYFGIQGHDAGDVEDEHLATRERREEKLDALNLRRAAMNPPKPPLTYDDLWPANTQLSANLAARGSGNGADDPDNPDPVAPADT